MAVELPLSNCLVNDQGQELEKYRSNTVAVYKNNHNFSDVILNSGELIALFEEEVFTVGNFVTPYLVMPEEKVSLITDLGHCRKIPASW